MPWSVELTGASYSIGEQNKDMTKSRQARGIKDTRTLLLALAERNSLTTHTDLINMDQHQYLGNCAHTPPITQHVIIS